MNERTIRRQRLHALERRFRRDRVRRHNLLRVVEALPLRARITIKVGVWVYRLRQIFTRTPEA